MSHTIFIILTPFQLRMMKQLFPEEIGGEQAHLFFTKHVSLQKKDYSGQLHPIPFETFSARELKRSPWKTIQEYRQRIKEIREYLEEFISRENFNEVTLVIGSEKDNFTQVLMNLLAKKKALQVQVHAVEEGTGYYVQESGSDKFKGFLYRLLTPLLFQEKIEYHRQLATDSRIDYVYARLPEMIPDFPGKSRKKYIAIQPPEASSPRTISGSDKVLVYSFPSEDYGITEHRKADIFRVLIEKFEGMTLVVKPHPREEVEVFKNFPGLQVIDRGSVGEDLDYFNFQAIVNFSSSVVIDILAEGYPADQVITIAIQPIPFPLFKKTQYLALSDLKEFQFEA